MSVDKLVDSTQLDADLTLIANAIRSKGGTSAQLAFPSDFVSAIGAISGGGEEDLLVRIIAQDTSLKTVISDKITGLGRYSFAFTGPEIISLPNCTTIGESCFSEEGIAATLSSVYLPKIQQLPTNAFRKTTRLKNVAFPSVRSAWSAPFFYAGLEAADFGEDVTFQFTGQFFVGCPLSVLVLRKNAVVPLNALTAFSSTPFADSGTGGTLYVPQARITEYTQATNWSTILGYANNSIAAIEGSIYETQYADGTPIT